MGTKSGASPATLMGCQLHQDAYRRALRATCRGRGAELIGLGTGDLVGSYPALWHDSAPGFPVTVLEKAGSSLSK